VEDDTHPASVDHAGASFVAASDGSERAQATDRFVVWRGAVFSAGESKRTAVRFCAAGRQNLDRRFHLHNLPGTLSDDQ